MLNSLWVQYSDDHVSISHVNDPVGLTSFSFFTSFEWILNKGKLKELR